MTDHPCKDFTQAQLEAFEMIAIGLHPNCTWPTIDAMLKAEVIERQPDDLRRDAMGFYNVAKFFVPVHVHIQWCQWCEENERELPS